VLAACVLAACGGDDDPYPEVEPTLAVSAEEQETEWNHKVFSEAAYLDERTVVVPYSPTDGFACFAIAIAVDLGHNAWQIDDVGSYTITVEKALDENEVVSWEGYLWNYDPATDDWWTVGRYSYDTETDKIELYRNAVNETEILEVDYSGDFNADDLIREAGACTLPEGQPTPAPFSKRGRGRSVQAWWWSLFLGQEGLEAASVPSEAKPHPSKVGNLGS